MKNDLGDIFYTFLKIAPSLEHVPLFSVDAYYLIFFFSISRLQIIFFLLLINPSQFLLFFFYLPILMYIRSVPVDSVCRSRALAGCQLGGCTAPPSPASL